MFVRFQLLTVVLLSMIGTTVFSQDISYPGWRGINRDGLTTILDLTSEDIAAPRLVWSVEAGEGTAAPIVGPDGSVFLFSRIDGKETLTCFDRDGKTQWSDGYEIEFEFRPNYHALPVGIGPLAAPTFGSGVVVGQGIAGTVTAWDAISGERLWQRTDGQRFGKTWPEYGASVSPLIKNDRVYFHVGNDKEGSFVAAELRSGEVVWEYKQDSPGYSPPVMMKIAGTEQIVHSGHRTLFGLDPKSGRQLWTVDHRVDEGLSIPTPTLVGNTVVVGGYRAGASGFNVLRIDDQWSVELAWQTNKVEMYLSSPVIVDGVLYGYSDKRKGQFFAMDPATGQLRWTGPGRNGENALLLATTNNRVLATTTEGDLIAFQCDPDSYQEVARFELTEQSLWCPVIPVGPSAFVIKDASKLLRFDLK